MSPAIADEAALVDLFLARRIPAWRVREALTPVLPPRTVLLDLHDVWIGEPALQAQVVAADYRIRLTGPRGCHEAVEAAVTEILQAPRLPRERERGDRRVPYDLRPFVVDANVARETTGPEVVLTFRLRHDAERGIGRPDEMLAELSARSRAPFEARETVRTGVVLKATHAGRAQQGRAGRGRRVPPESGRS